jgi:hypothetical protein
LLALATGSLLTNVSVSASSATDAAGLLAAETFALTPISMVDVINNDAVAFFMFVAPMCTSEVHGGPLKNVSHVAGV